MDEQLKAYEVLIRLDQKVDDLHVALLGNQGRIPKVEADVVKVEADVEKHAAQIHEWVGSIKIGVWIVGALLTIFGGTLAAHIWSESNQQHNIVVIPATQPARHTPATPSLTP